jgi:hypothetical protein
VLDVFVLRLVEDLQASRGQFTALLINCLRSTPLGTKALSCDGVFGALSDTAIHSWRCDHGDSTYLVAGFVTGKSDVARREATTE